MQALPTSAKGRKRPFRIQPKADVGIRLRELGGAQDCGAFVSGGSTPSFPAMALQEKLLRRFPGL